MNLENTEIQSFKEKGEENMSVVVAIKQDGKIFMGADSQSTKGGTRTTLSNPNNYKIWKVNGVENCLMSQIGTVRNANVIRVMDELVTETADLKQTVDFEYVVKILVPKIMKELKTYSLNLRDSDGLEKMNSSFLFAYHDNLFMIDAYGSVIEVDDFCAIGSGTGEAIGSLLSTINITDPIKRIQEAIKASAAHDIYVDYPIIITDTESTEFKVFYEKDLNPEKKQSDKKTPKQVNQND